MTTRRTLIPLLLAAVCASPLKAQDGDPFLPTMEGDPRVVVSEDTVSPAILEASKAVGRLSVPWLVKREHPERKGEDVWREAVIHGSFVLVAPNIALTSAHSFPDRDGDEERLDTSRPIELMLGYRNGAATHRTRVRHFEENGAIDIAYLVLETPVPASVARPIPLSPRPHEKHFPIHFDPDTGDYGRQGHIEATLLGYSSDRDLGRKGEHLTADYRCLIGRSTTHDNALADSECVSYPGASGGAVVIEEDGRALLMGIVSGTNQIYVVGKHTTDFINKDVFAERLAEIIAEHAP